MNFGMVRGASEIFLSKILPILSILFPSDTLSNRRIKDDVGVSVAGAEKQKNPWFHVGRLLGRGPRLA
jgi:hypothetical protein